MLEREIETAWVGRREIARFHSDADRPMFKGGVPHWFRRVFKKRQRMSNTQRLLRWLEDPGYKPVHGR